MKKLANLKGAKMLSKAEQKSINGGGTKQLCCDPTLNCCTTNPPPGGRFCAGTTYGNTNCQYLYSTGIPNCCI